MKYFSEIEKAMNLLAEHPKTIFLGQSVSFSGNVIYKTLKDIPSEKKIETPVFEDTQMGISIGLALSGLIPVSVFPRFNFLLLAVNQLVNHLDKIPHISHDQWRPKVIIKTMVGSCRPLDPGVQHKGNFTEALKLMLDDVIVEDLQWPEQIVPAYQRALDRNGSTVLVEYGDHYSEK